MCRLFNNPATAWYHRVLEKKATDAAFFAGPKRIGCQTRSFVVWQPKPLISLFCGRFRCRVDRPFEDVRPMPQVPWMQERRCSPVRQMGVWVSRIVRRCLLHRTDTQPPLSCLTATRQPRKLCARGRRGRSRSRRGASSFVSFSFVSFSSLSSLLSFLSVVPLTTRAVCFAAARRRRRQARKPGN